MPSLDIYLPDLSGGGAERLHVQLAPLFRDGGFETRFLLDRAGGALADQVAPGVGTTILGAARQLSALPRLIAHLKRRQPDILLANMEHMNVMAVIARAIARVDTRIVVTQHNAFSEQVKRKSWQWRAMPSLYRLLLPRADAIVAVSAGVADELAAMTGIARSRIAVIHNGLVTGDFAARTAAPVVHPWLAEGRPILGMGRLVPQKDFATLIRAFAALDGHADARLLILGEGPLRGELEALARDLGVADRVSLPGFVVDPLPWLARARLFVLSSRFEGFGNVLVEALACGTPVVSTDCPYGPSEILDEGRFGRLVLPNEPEAMARAIDDTLRETADRAALATRGAHFGVHRCAAEYMALFESVCGVSGDAGLPGEAIDRHRTLG